METAKGKSKAKTTPVDDRKAGKRKATTEKLSKSEKKANKTDLHFHFTTTFTEASMKYSRPFFCEMTKKPLDQLVIRPGPLSTSILQIRPTRKHQKVKLIRRFPFDVAHNVLWSPRGSYLLVIGETRQTLGIFGGDHFDDIMHYDHPEVEQAEFSPGERYLVTYSKPKRGSDTNSLWLKVFRVITGRLIAGSESHVTNAPVMIRWSGGSDDKYFSILHKNTASVYETETFSLLGQEHVSVSDVLDLSWSPTESILVLLKGGCKLRTTRVVIVQIPSKDVLMQKNILSSVSSDCKMYWQSNGKYLAVKFDLQNTLSSLVELFCFNEKGTTTNVNLEVNKFIAFSWEPNSHRFAVIHGDQLERDVVSFYEMDENGNASIQTAYENKQVNALFWSPRGKHIVLADLKDSSNAHLEILDVDNNKLETLSEPVRATDIAWDPTGRYVATSVTVSEEKFKWGKRKIDGFKLWSSTGELLYSSPSPEYSLLQLSWRPYGGTIEDEMLKNEDIEDESDGSLSGEGTIEDGGTTEDEMLKNEDIEDESDGSLSGEGDEESD